MLLDAMELFPSLISRKPNRTVDFEEVVLHKRLKDFAPSLSGISGMIRPDQTMCNYFSEQIAAALNVSPPFTPYVTAPLRSAPFAGSNNEHLRALEAFDKKMKRYDSAQSLGIQQFILYKMRFIFAGEVCQAFSLFGGFCAQINALSVLLNIAIVDNPFIAMRYGELLSARLAGFARERMPNINYMEILSNEDVELMPIISDK